MKWIDKKKTLSDLWEKLKELEKEIEKIKKGFEKVYAND